MAFFYHAHPKIIESTFIFPEFVTAWKNDFIPSVHFWVPWPDWPYPFLTMPTQKIFDQLLILWPRINMQTISLFHQLFLEIQSILESRDQTGHTHFWPCPIKKLFSQLVSTCKNWGRFTDLLWRNAWFKNPAIGMAESILACI